PVAELSGVLLISHDATPFNVRRSVGPAELSARYQDVTHDGPHFSTARTVWTVHQRGPRQPPPDTEQALRVQSSMPTATPTFMHLPRPRVPLAQLPPSATRRQPSTSRTVPTRDSELATHSVGPLEGFQHERNV